MKKIIMLLAAGAMALGFTACDDDKKSTSIIPGSDLILPRDNYSVDLGKNQTVMFQWDATSTQDNAYITYEILFDRESGDFSNPIFVMLSEANGFRPSVAISGANMTKIANYVGGDPGQTITLKWTVRAYRRLTSTMYDTSRTIDVTFADPMPNTLTMSGEGGENLTFSPARPIFTKKSEAKLDAIEGAFECFVKLSAGDMTITDDFGRYYTLESGGTISMGMDPSVTTNTESGIYWLYINFPGKTWSMKKISKVELWTCPWWYSNPTLKELGYDAKGVWSITDYAWDIGVVAENRIDSRYYFICTYADGSSERWSHIEDDCRSGNNPAGKQYFYNIFRFTRVIADADNWAHSWKTIENTQEGLGKLATFHVYMNSDQDQASKNYIHTRSFR